MTFPTAATARVFVQYSIQSKPGARTTSHVPYSTLVGTRAIRPSLLQESSSCYRSITEAGRERESFRALRLVACPTKLQIGEGQRRQRRNLARICRELVDFTRKDSLFGGVEMRRLLLVWLSLLLFSLNADSRSSRERWVSCLFHTSRTRDSDDFRGWRSWWFFFFLRLFVLSFESWSKLGDLGGIVSALFLRFDVSGSN